MAKTKYNPIQALQNDPLASLKQATMERAEIKSSAAQWERSFPLSASQEADSGAEAPEMSSSHPETRWLSSAPVKPLGASLKPSRNTVYLYPEDLTKLRQLSGYASIEHGIRANDSMIMRAALSLMEADVRFLHALKDAVLSDRRRTPKQA